MFEDGDRPAPLVEPVGREIVCGLGAVAIFRSGDIEAGQQSGATLLRQRPVALVGEMVIDAAEEKIAQLPAIRIGGANGVLFQKAREETLGEIFRILRRMAAAPDVSVNGIPVGFAELAERGLCGRAVTLCRLADKAPASRFKGVRGRRLAHGRTTQGRAPALVK